MRRPTVIVTIALAALVAAGCAGSRDQRPTDTPGDRERNIHLILSYDVNSDGTVTRAELEAGLRRQFAVADINHDGHIDPTEMRAENDRRWAAAGTASSPLIDWNQDGVVDFDEFATTARSVFEDLDRDHDGMLTPMELRLPAIRGMAPGAPNAGARRGRQGMPP